MVVITPAKRATRMPMPITTVTGVAPASRRRRTGVVSSVMIFAPWP